MRKLDASTAIALVLLAIQLLIPWTVPHYVTQDSGLLLATFVTHLIPAALTYVRVYQIARKKE